MTDMIFQIRHAFMLTPRLAKLLELLLNNQFVTSDMIEHEHRIFTDSKVAVHKLRRRMGFYGFEVLNMRGAGYYLEDLTKERLIAKMNPAKAA